MFNAILIKMEEDEKKKIFHSSSRAAIWLEY